MKLYIFLWRPNPPKFSQVAYPKDTSKSSIDANTAWTGLHKHIAIQQLEDMKMDQFPAASVYGSHIGYRCHTEVDGWKCDKCFLYDLFVLLN